MGKRKLYRQGDVLLVKLENSIQFHDYGNPQDGCIGAHRHERDSQGRVVLARGETTGHAHAIHDPGVVAWSLLSDDRTILDVPQDAKLVHEEHETIELPPGQYQVIRQREATDRDEWAMVAD